MEGELEARPGQGGTVGTISGHLSDKPGPQRSKARGPFFTELGLRGGERPLDGLRWGAQVFQPRLQPAILCPDRALSACADGQVTRASQQRPSLRGPSIPIRGLLAGPPGTHQPARPRPSTAPGRGESPAYAPLPLPFAAGHRLPLTPGHGHGHSHRPVGLGSSSALGGRFPPFYAPGLTSIPPGNAAGTTALRL